MPCEGCEVADAEVQITGPAMEDLFLNNKGTLVCKVKANRQSVTKTFWEDQDGNEMAGASKSPPAGRTGTFTLPLDITYDEWSSGIKRVCVVEHSNLLDSIKTTYERRIGKTTAIINSKLVLDIMPSCMYVQSVLESAAKSLIALSFLQKSQLSVLQCLCCRQ